MGGRREAPSCPAPLGAGLALGDPFLLLALSFRATRSSSSIASNKCNSPGSEPPPRLLWPRLRAPRGWPGISEVSAASPFAFHNANADGSLVANLLSLAAESVRTGEQSAEPIAVNHVHTARGVLARTHPGR